MKTKHYILIATMFSAIILGLAGYIYWRMGDSSTFGGECKRIDGLGIDIDVG